MYQLQVQRKGSQGKTMPRLHINQGIRRKRQYKVETAYILAEAPGEIKGEGP